jgi:hypothetical protein
MALREKEASKTDDKTIVSFYHRLVAIYEERQKLPPSTLLHKALSLEMAQNDIDFAGYI